MVERQLPGLHVTAGSRSSTSSHLIKLSTKLKVITVSINGATRQFPDFTVVSVLIEELGLTGKRIALERNGEIVPRGLFAVQQLADGDKLEVVVAVGGG
jgi:sulfur carrier protein